MLRKSMSLTVVLATIVLCGTSALALDFMGPPASSLKKKQFGAGLEYSFGDMDLSWNRGKKCYAAGGAGPLSSVKFNTDWEMRKISAYLEYGVVENWEVFMRLGCVVVDGQGDMPWGTEGNLNGNHNKAYGFGTRVTVWEPSPKIKWGAMFQVNWNNNLKGEMHTVMNGQTTPMKFGYDFTEYQFAFGPLYKIKEKFHIYGGPFLHFVNGSVRSKGNFNEGGGSIVRKYSWNIDERSILGGYIGLQADIIKNKMPFYVEYQHTAFADMLAMNLILRL
jgi:hypothetical protein